MPVFRAKEPASGLRGFRRNHRIPHAKLMVDREIGGWQNGARFGWRGGKRIAPPQRCVSRERHVPRRRISAVGIRSRDSGRDVMLRYVPADDARTWQNGIVDRAQRLEIGAIRIVHFGLPRRDIRPAPAPRRDL